MRFILVTFLSIFTCLNALAIDFQKYGWSEEQIQKANTSINTRYLNDDEKEVILIMNLSRMYPKYFSKVMLAMWADHSASRLLFAQMCGIEYSTSLIKDLENSNPLHPLKPDKKLYKYARIHAQKMGRIGRTGHGRRYNYSVLEQLRGLNRYRNVAENCSYGCHKPIDIVMQLLVDDGVASLGHRKNILDAGNGLVGLSIQPHKKYEWNCVLDFR